MKKVFLMAAVAAGALYTTACSSDEKSGVEPTADFSFSMKSDLTVTFTNNSADGITYAWDFGDGETSTDESPVHKFAEKKAYTVTLTATNGDYTNEATKTVDCTKAPSVDIDGAFTDWANVTGMTIPNDQEKTGIQAVKVTSDDNYIYLYVETEKAATHQVTVYFKMQAEPATYYGPEWLYGGEKMDCCIIFTNMSAEGWPTTAAEGDPGLTGYDKQLTAWEEGMNVLKLAAESSLNNTSHLVDVAGKTGVVAFETSIKKELIPAPYVPGNTFDIGFYLQDPAWTDAGYLPMIGVAPVKAYTYNQTTKTLAQ